MNHAVITAAAAIAISTSTPAAAWDKWQPTHYDSFAAVDLGVWSASSVGTTIPLVFSGQYVVDDVPLAIGGRFPIVGNIDGPALSDSSRSASRVSLGNIDVAVTYLGRNGRTWWWLSGGLGLPLATAINDDSLVANAFAVASASGRDLDLWSSRVLPFHLSAGFDWRPERWLSLRFITRPVILAPIATRDTAEFAWENLLGVEFRHDVGLGGGLDLPITWWATAPAPLDLSHVALFPYVSYSGDSDDSHLFVRLGLWMALNEPLGFAFDRGKVATLRIAVGTTLK